jgi:hypothetical protein
MHLMSLLFTPFAGEAESYVDVLGATPAIAAESDVTYICTSTVTALTISSIPEEGIFAIIFKAGNTAPQITGPSCLVYRDGTEIVANKINELSVRCFKIGNMQCAQGLNAPFNEPASS